MSNKKVEFGLTLANRGVMIGVTTVDEMLEMSKIADDSKLYDWIWVGDSILAKPRLEAITILSAVAARHHDVGWLIDQLGQSQSERVGRFGGDTMPLGPVFIGSGVDVEPRVTQLERVSDGALVFRWSGNSHPAYLDQGPVHGANAFVLDPVVVSQKDVRAFLTHSNDWNEHHQRY